MRQQSTARSGLASVSSCARQLTAAQQLSTAIVPWLIGQLV